VEVHGNLFERGEQRREQRREQAVGRR